MIKLKMKCLKILILFFMLAQTVYAEKCLDISQTQQIEVLPNSTVYIDNTALTLKEILANNLFQPYNKPYINIGIDGRTVWISFSLCNSSSKKIEKLLILTSPRLEHISLYTQDNLEHPIHLGVSHIQNDHSTLFPFYRLSLSAKSEHHFYLKIKSIFTPVDFTLKIENEKDYVKEDRIQQFIDILLIGFVLALAFYSFFLFFYTKDKSYLFYSIYLMNLIWQQITYLGLTQIYFPPHIITFDMQMTAIKVHLLIITSTLFAMSFLRTESIPFLHRVYKAFILLSATEIILLSIFSFYNLHIMVFTGALFIVYNLSAAIFSYVKGSKQARLFIAGFIVVFVSYMLIILNAIGLTSVMQEFQNLLMFATATEALILSIAFADRYLILQKEKAQVDKLILMESKNRTKIIENEVIEKTRDLNHALQGKELLLKEVHHRVKNNLQIILSMIRLQNDEIKNTEISEKLNNLENRINAISQTYNMLLLKDDIEEVNMQEYIEALLLDIERSLTNNQQIISIETDIDAIIPLREAVYIGLIVNELVTNAYKYAFDTSGNIFISLKHEKNNYILRIEDDGKGYTSQEKHQSLGLKLVHTLIYEQLEGRMEIETQKHCKYTIRFSL